MRGAIAVRPPRLGSATSRVRATSAARSCGSSGSTAVAGTVPTQCSRVPASALSQVISSGASAGISSRTARTAKAPPSSRVKRATVKWLASW